MFIILDPSLHVNNHHDHHRNHVHYREESS